MVEDKDEVAGAAAGTVDAEMSDAVTCDERKSLDEEDASSLKDAVSDLDEEGNPIEDLSAEERLTFAVSCKEAGNTLLKSADFVAARDKYAEGAKYLKTMAIDVPNAADVKKAIHMNLALAYIKLEAWHDATTSATKALEIEPTNPKALFRRGLARSRDGNLDGAKQDLLQLVNAEPNNLEARKELVAVKQKLARTNEQNKKAFGGMFGKVGSGLYADREAEKREKLKKEAEQRKKDEAEWKEECDFRKGRGEETMKFDEWLEKKNEAKKAEEEEARKKASDSTTLMGRKAAKAKEKDDVSADSEYDEEDRKIMEETKKKGYCYFGKKDLTEEEKRAQPIHRPTPVDTTTTAATGTTPSPSPSSGDALSSWNSAGATWEEKDKTSWAKAELKKRLKKISVKQTPFESLSSSPDQYKNTFDDILSTVQPTASDDGAFNAERLAKLGALTASFLGMTGKITDVSSISGDASVAVVSGSRRFLYDFELTLNWEIDIDDHCPDLHTKSEDLDKTSEKKTFTGTMTFHDVSSTRLSGKGHWAKEGRSSYTSKAPQEAHLKSAVDLMIKKLKEEIEKAVDAFEVAFKSS